MQLWRLASAKYAGWATKPDTQERVYEQFKSEVILLAEFSFLGEGKPFSIKVCN